MPETREPAERGKEGDRRAEAPTTGLERLALGLRDAVAAYVVLAVTLTVLRAGPVEAGLPVEGSAASGWSSHASTWGLAGLLGAVLGQQVQLAHQLQ